MTSGQRTVASMLAVVAVMLGLNLIVGGLRPAVAQEPEFRIFPEPPPVVPKVVAVSVDQTWHWFSPAGGPSGPRSYWLVTRAWDDGQVDVTTVFVNGGSSCPVPLLCGSDTAVIIPGS